MAMGPYSLEVRHKGGAGGPTTKLHHGGGGGLILRVFANFTQIPALEGVRDKSDFFLFLFLEALGTPLPSLSPPISDPLGTAFDPPPHPPS